MIIKKLLLNFEIQKSKIIPEDSAFEEVIEEKNPADNTNEINRLGNSLNDKYFKSKQIINILKTTKFYSWLETITVERIKKFTELKLFQLPDSFEKRYVNEENLGNLPVPFIYKAIFKLLISVMI